jgi:hypothetical protein
MTAQRVWRAAVRAWNGIPLREPWRLLVPLLVIHWLALVAFTTRVNHNGWLFYQGGDQIWYWTNSWLMGHGWMTWPIVSPGWPLMLLPFSWIGGPGFLGGLPGAMLLQIAVLAPIALWCMYELGARIGGRVVGYAASVLWVLGPYLAVPLFVHRYHDRYVDQFLPIPLGLTAMADYAGMVFLLASALFATRAIENRDPGTAALAGLTAGFSFLVKPSNAIFVAGPLVALIVARRWRELAVGAAAITPAVLALTLWKYRGYGFVPALTYDDARVALGSDALQASFTKYGEIDWQHLEKNLDDLREFFWSVRVLQWLPIAGAVAVARRSTPFAVLLSLWFWPFLLIKGSAIQATVDSGSFFRLLLPAIPAFVLLTVSIPLLLPKYGVRLWRKTALPPARPIGRGRVVVSLVALGLVPIAATAAVQPTKTSDRVLQEAGIATPVHGELTLQGNRRGNTIMLEWNRPRTRGSRVFFKVFRSPAAVDHLCFDSSEGGASQCVLSSQELRTARGTSATDRPGSGTWTYRVGAAANWLDDTELGDVFLLSNPVTVRVP